MQLAAAQEKEQVEDEEDKVRKEGSEEGNGGGHVNVDIKALRKELPEGWRVYLSSSGKPYWYNKATHVTQWKPPAMAADRHGVAGGSQAIEWESAWRAEAAKDLSIARVDLKDPSLSSSPLPTSAASGTRSRRGECFLNAMCTASTYTA